MKTEKKKSPMSRCDCCSYYTFDDEADCYSCEIDLDEDEMEKFLSCTNFDCPYYNPYDEYKVVRKQN